MNKKHRATLAAVFTLPVRANIAWDDIEALLVALGAVISSGRGSRVRIELNGCRFSLHRPHPQKEVDRGAVAALRLFLERTGVSLDGE